MPLVPERRWLRVALAFALPFLFIAGGVGITAGSLSLGALCGGVVGGLFVVSFAIASTGRSNPLGRWFGALLLFFGFAAVLCGLAFFGCRVIGFRTNIKETIWVSPIFD